MNDRKRQVIAYHPALRAMRERAAWARACNPRVLPVMDAPPRTRVILNWRPQTAYQGDDHVVAGARLLRALNAGTSGASEPAPSGDAGLDGSVRWAHAGRADMGLSRMYSWQGPHAAVFGLYGGAPKPVDAGHPDNARHFGSVTVGGNKSSQVFRIETVVDAARCCFHLTDAARYRARYRIVVDDRFVSMEDIVQDHARRSEADRTRLLLDFSHAGGRRVRRIMLEGVMDSSFHGVSVGPTDCLMPPPAIALRLFYIGDSYAGATGEGEWITTGHGMMLGVADRLGIRDVWGAAIGGAGYLNGLGSVATRESRVQDAVDARADCVIVALGVNDTRNQGEAFTPERLREEAAGFHRALRAALPDTPVFVVGPCGGTTGPNTHVIAAEQAIAEAVAMADHALTWFIPVSTDAAGPWLFGTGRTEDPTGDGNTDVYVTDGLHPNRAGHAYLASRLADAIGRAIEPLR